MRCGKRQPGENWVGQHKGVRADCILHPLIHIFPGFAQAQDVGKKKSGAKNPHFLSLNQDVVASPQDEKCGLKYVMFNQS
jgi:hypothetical protein